LGDAIFDPLAGGFVRGIVASKLGLPVRIEGDARDAAKRRQAMSGSGS
jgi:hypothetical protein